MPPTKAKPESAQQRRRPEAISKPRDDLGVLGRVGGSPRVSVFRNLDPDCPPGERFCAHAFDQTGRLRVATKLGPDESCGEALAAFLDEQIERARAFSAKRSPEQMRALRSRRRQE